MRGAAVLRPTEGPGPERRRVAERGGDPCDFLLVEHVGADEIFPRCLAVGAAGTGNHARQGRQIEGRHPRIHNGTEFLDLDLGVINSETLPANQYFGAGVTGFGLVPNRPADSMGFGMAW